MKYSVGIKILAFVLATVALVVTAVGAVGIVVLAEQGLYAVDYDRWEEQFYETRAASMAEAVAESYAARSQGNMSVEELNAIGWGNFHTEFSDMWNIDKHSWAYSIYDTNGVLLEKVNPISVDKTDLEAYVHTLRVTYPVRVYNSAEWTEKVAYWLSDGRKQVMYLQYQESPSYEVMIWLVPGCLESFSGISLDLYQILHHFRYHLIWVTALSLVVSVACLIYLCFAAGKSSKKEGVCPGGLNRLPLDLYGVALGLLALEGGVIGLELLEDALFFSDGLETLWYLAGAGGAALAAGLCAVALLFAVAAQWKMGWRYVLGRSAIGWCAIRLWGLLRKCGKVLCKLYNLLPLIWKYLLIAFGMAAVPALICLLCVANHGFGRAFWLLVLFGAILADIAMVCYGAYAYGTVLQGAKRMAAGDLWTGVDTRYLRGSYKSCGEDLNQLADVVEDAAQKQLRSDRMKTELITNVSHDIKTPLTSVINYIDLLQKAQTEEQKAEYLEVLERQAQKLKKLIDDLMEMSKATTGDMAVDITAVDAVETMTQALGEFADKLKKQDLTVVFRKPEEPVSMQADGRLVWRVLSNLMGNIVKYALPGTRVYAEVRQLDLNVQLSLKNISREELNVSAEELTERFVRGDASRNTEGSGLGLNIAKSLMELQKGSLELTVDGDLFKVTLTFPVER